MRRILAILASTAVAASTVAQSAQARAAENIPPGGSVEHRHEDAGQVWMARLTRHFRKAAWLNPVDQSHWRYTQSIGIMERLMENRMYPLTLAGLETMARQLAR